MEKKNQFPWQQKSVSVVVKINFHGDKNQFPRC